MEVFKDLVKGSEQVGAVRDNNRQSPQGSHLAMVGDGVAVLFWVVQPAKPDEYVGEVLGGARTYGNRILTEHRNKYGLPCTSLLSVPILISTEINYMSTGSRHSLNYVAH